MGFVRFRVEGCKAAYLRSFGGTPNRDPGSLWGLICGHPRDIGVT